MVGVSLMNESETPTILIEALLEKPDTESSEEVFTTWPIASNFEESDLYVPGGSETVTLRN